MTKVKNRNKKRRKRSETQIKQVKKKTEELYLRL